MTDSIQLQFFRKFESQEAYDAYRQIKHEVFVRECGWNDLDDNSSPNRAREDPHDEMGQFLLARNSDGEPIGILRSNVLSESFPHEALFKEHLGSDTVQRFLDRVCMLNALAVLPKYRKWQFTIQEEGMSGSVGKLLVLTLMRLLESRGLVGALVTSGGNLATSFFIQLGFHIIDPMRKMSLHKEPLTNLGIVFGGPKQRTMEERCKMTNITTRPWNNSAQELEDYFTQRELDLS